MHQIERDDVVALLKRDELSYTDIAQATGLSRSRVGQLWQRLQARERWQERAKEEERRPVLDRDVFFLPLSYRVRRILGSVGTDYSSWRAPDPPPTPRIKYVRDLVLWTAPDLLMLYDFGRKSFTELYEFLSREGVSLKATPPPPPAPEWTYEYNPCPYCHGTGHKWRRVQANKDV